MRPVPEGLLKGLLRTPQRPYRGRAVKPVHQRRVEQNLGSLGARRRIGGFYGCARLVDTPRYVGNAVLVVIPQDVFQLSRSARR